jgi:hypothetical protein
VRILFQLPYPGYLRIYGSTLALLAERGHTVLLAYDTPDKRRDPTAASVEGHGQLVAPLPRARRRGEGAIEKLRLATDYSRYLTPPFADSHYLRRRLDPQLTGALRVLTRLPSGLRVAEPAMHVLLAAARSVPSDAGIERVISAHAPDAVVVTPLIGRTRRGLRQTDTVQGARRLGIPVGLSVASWDHLTTKGLVKAVPDRVFVWNEFQAREAVDLHGLEYDRVVVTGAQLFDTWFARSPSTSREQFLASAGLPQGAPFVLYVGSSRNIAPAEREIAFVLRWLRGLRAGGEPELGVVIRPHPGNASEWAEAEVSDGRAVVLPRGRPSLPMSPADEALYYDSIHHSAAVVGINTSAMVESFVQRRPVLSIRSSEFESTQDGTLHFRYLLPEAGGPLRAASTVEEHIAQLRETLAAPERDRQAIEAFLRSFVRPHGIDRPATPILADAVEALGARD